MLYVKRPMGYSQDPKYLRLSPGARCVWHASWDYSGINKTDGYIDRDVLAFLLATEGDAHELAAAGFWEDVEGGWYVNGYLEVGNRTRAKIEDISKKRSEAGMVGGLAAGRGRPLANDRQNAGNAVSVVVVGSDPNSPPESDGWDTGNNNNKQLAICLSAEGEALVRRLIEDFSFEGAREFVAKNDSGLIGDWVDWFDAGNGGGMDVPAGFIRRRVEAGEPPAIPSAPPSPANPFKESKERLERIKAQQEAVA